MTSRMGGIPRRFVAVAALLVILGLSACAARDWPAFRHDAMRTAKQPRLTALADPAQVPGLHVVWSFHPQALRRHFAHRLSFTRAGSISAMATGISMLSTPRPGPCSGNIRRRHRRR